MTVSANAEARPRVPKDLVIRPLELGGECFELGGRGRFALSGALAHPREDRGGDGPSRVR